MKQVKVRPKNYSEIYIFKVTPAKINYMQFEFFTEKAIITFKMITNGWVAVVMKRHWKMGRILIPYSKMHVDALIKKEQMCGKFDKKISNSWVLIIRFDVQGLDENYSFSYAGADPSFLFY